MSKKSESFDVIVIGAGSAGCIVAGRLASVSGCRVLLLEAGGQAADPWLTIPAGYYRTLQNPKVDWGYIADKERGLDGRRIRLRQGKVLGGGSAVNGMVYIRGAATDFDGWAEKLDDANWSYSNVLPLFRRSENNRNLNNAYHGTDGPISVAWPAYRSRLTETFIEAAIDTGLSSNEDFNGPMMEGVGYYQLTAYELRRSSAADFLAEQGANLEVRLNHQVSRIILRNGCAIGVEVIDSDYNISTIYCDGEIVLSAGAIATPSILQRSGIGPASLLEGVGVPVVLDNPEVGMNLQDHLQVRVIFETDETDSLNAQQNSVLQAGGLPEEGGDHLSVGAGLAGLFAKTEDVSSPDIQFHVLPFSEEVPGRMHGVGGITTSVCLLRPKSRGSVAITEANPFSSPRIHCSYLTSPGDEIPLREGLRLLGRIADRMTSVIKSSLSPISLSDSDDALDAYVRRIASTIYHPVGTCAMGKLDGVVDSQLRVKGITSLWVADASIMPTIVSGNTNAACLMIGERAADEIIATMG